MEPEPTSRDVARATLVLAATHAVQLVASLANLELLTRALGPARYGDVASVLATYALLGALTDLGTGLVAVRRMAREPERAREVLVTVLRLRLVAGALGGVLGFWHFADRGEPAGLVGAALPVIQAWSSSRLLLQATLAKTWLAVAQTLGRVVQVGLVALAVGARGDTSVAAILAIAGGELTIAALLRVSVGELPRVSWRASARDGASLAIEALPIAGAFLANELAGSFDVLLLRAARTSEETGLYALASRPLQVLEPVPRLLLWSIFPILARRAAADDAAAIARTHRATVSALALAAAPVAAGATLCGPALLAALFDDRYAAAGEPLVVLAWGAALGFLAAPAESTLVAVGGTRRNLVASLGALAVNITSNVVLIPRHGALGAAWAWVATAAAQLLLGQWLLGVRFPAIACARSALAGVILYAALSPLSGHPFAQLALGAPLYVLLTVVTGAVRAVKKTGES